MERVIGELARAVGLRVSPDVAAAARRAGQQQPGDRRVRSSRSSRFTSAPSPASPRELDHDTLDLLSADAAEGDFLRLGDLALAGRMDALARGARAPAAGRQ